MAVRAARAAALIHYVQVLLGWQLCLHSAMFKVGVHVFDKAALCLPSGCNLHGTQPPAILWLTESAPTQQPAAKNWMFVSIVSRCSIYTTKHLKGSCVYMC